ncbi:YgaP-like transmembrane domain [Lichenihabitans psoromatis]|nr:YgaP-like transmembrane domain [Lichenihabitans psoromatis]
MSTNLPMESHDHQNISMGERSLSVVGGLVLAAAAAKPRPNPLLNIAALAIGSYLAYRGATGFCPIKA